MAFGRILGQVVVLIRKYVISQRLQRSGAGVICGLRFLGRVFVRDSYIKIHIGRNGSRVSRSSVTRVIGSTLTVASRRHIKGAVKFAVFITALGKLTISDGQRSPRRRGLEERKRKHRFFTVVSLVKGDWAICMRWCRNGDWSNWSRFLDSTDSFIIKCRSVPSWRVVSCGRDRSSTVASPGAASRMFSKDPTHTGLAAAPHRTEREDGAFSLFLLLSHAFLKDRNLSSKTLHFGLGFLETLLGSHQTVT